MTNAFEIQRVPNYNTYRVLYFIERKIVQISDIICIVKLLHILLS